MRGCRVRHATPPDTAPSYIVFETRSGERHGLLAYAFFANAKLTRNRPEDEHRFQIKYGGDLKGVLKVATDPTALITTIFLGIDPYREIFIAADPFMNDPSPMSRSIEFKSAHVAEILKRGWLAWERDRKQPKTKTRPTPNISEDTRVQVLIGGKKERLLDLIMLESIAYKLDPGERHLIADTLRSSDRRATRQRSHALLQELHIPPEALFDLIDSAPRLKMAVRGWVAEKHLEDELRKVPGVSECRRIEEGEADVSLRWKGSAPILIECKNVLRKTDGLGRPRVDFQRTRASKQDPCSRYYRPTEFPILAACLHAVEVKWRFSYALTHDLPAHGKCIGRITSNLTVKEPTFTPHAEIILDRHIDIAKGASR